MLQDNYKQLKQYRVGGMFEFMTPTMMVTDPEIIRDICVKNFDYFHDRRMIVNEE
jgi:cytochrome P450 family 9